MSDFGNIQPERKKRSTGRMILVILILVLSLSFIFSNFEFQALRFLMWSTPELPMWLWLLVTFAVGVLLGGVVRGGIRKMRHKDQAPQKK